MTTHSMNLLCLAALLTLMVSSTVVLADPPLSMEEVRQEVLARIQAANETLPVAGNGAKSSLLSYRTIDPYIIAELVSGIGFIYSSIISTYPEFVLYDLMDLKLQSVRYVPQRVEFNYVNRV